MSAEFNPLKERERHVIKSGTEILGGAFLSRAAIVVDVEENPGMYNTVLDAINGNVATLSRLGDEVPSHTILRATDKMVGRFVRLHDEGYQRILKHEAELRGLTRVTQDDEIGLSRFISMAGICQQHSLLAATMLRLLQERGDLGGTVSLETGKSILYPNAPLDHPDRHTRVIFSEEGQDYSLDINTGVSRLHEPFQSLEEGGIGRLESGSVLR